MYFQVLLLEAFLKLSSFSSSSSKTGVESPLQVYLEKQAFGYGTSSEIALGTKIVFSQQNPDPFSNLQDALDATDLQAECDKRLVSEGFHRLTVQFHFKDDPEIEYGENVGKDAEEEDIWQSNVALYLSLFKLLSRLNDIRLQNPDLRDGNTDIEIQNEGRIKTSITDDRFLKTFNVNVNVNCDKFPLSSYSWKQFTEHIEKS